jgi:hypothetical protein
MKAETVQLSLGYVCRVYSAEYGQVGYFSFCQQSNGGVDV